MLELLHSGLIEYKSKMDELLLDDNNNIIRTIFVLTMEQLQFEHVQLRESILRNADGQMEGRCWLKRKQWDNGNRHLLDKDIQRQYAYFREICQLKMELRKMKEQRRELKEKIVKLIEEIEEAKKGKGRKEEIKIVAKLRRQLHGQRGREPEMKENEGKMRIKIEYSIGRNEMDWRERLDELEMAMSMKNARGLLLFSVLFFPGVGILGSALFIANSMIIQSKRRSQRRNQKMELENLLEIAK